MSSNLVSLIRNFAFTGTPASPTDVEVLKEFIIELWRDLPEDLTASQRVWAWRAALNFRTRNYKACYGDISALAELPGAKHISESDAKHFLEGLTKDQLYEWVAYSIGEYESGSMMK